MFGTIRKHSTLLWVPIIFLTCLSMVWFFTDYRPGDSSGGKVEVDLGTINGRPISQEEYLNAQQEVRLFHFFQSGGKWPTRDAASEERLENESVYRVFLIQKLKEMDIQASKKSVALLEHAQLRDESYANFEKIHFEPNQVSIADYKRFVRHQAALQQLFSAVTVPGRLTTPAEAETLWRKENQQLAAQLAVFWTSNYLDKVTITNGALGTFYTNRASFYRLPERLTLAYVEFTASNHLGEADTEIAALTNLNEIVSDFYSRTRMDTNRWTDTNGAPLPEAAAKEKIKEEFRLNKALAAAHRAAAGFGNQLMNQADPNKVSTLENLAKSNNLPVKITKPFDNRDGGLEEFDDDPVFQSSDNDAEPESLRDVIRKKAFALPEGSPVLFNPIVGKHAVYLFARQSRMPSEAQPMDKVQDKVIADYKYVMASQLARAAGQSFHTNLTNGLALKKSFADLCAAERVKTIELPPFSAATRGLTNLDSRINLRYIQTLAQDTEIGQASAFLPAQPASEGGFILYAKARPPVDEAKLKAELPEFINRLKAYRQDEAFQQWFRKQAEQARIVVRKRETTIGGQN